MFALHWYLTIFLFLTSSLASPLRSMEDEEFGIGFDFTPSYG